MRRIVCFFRVIAYLPMLCLGGIALAHRAAGRFLLARNRTGQRLEVERNRAAGISRCGGPCGGREGGRGQRLAGCRGNARHDPRCPLRARQDRSALAARRHGKMSLGRRSRLDLCRPLRRPTAGTPELAAIQRTEGPSRRLSQRRARRRARRHGRAADGRCQRPASPHQHARAALPFVRSGAAGNSRRPTGRTNVGSYLGPNPNLTSTGVFDTIFLASFDGHVMTEVVAGSALDESLARATVTVDTAGKSHLPKVDVRLRVLDPEGQVVGEKTTSARRATVGSRSACSCRLTIRACGGRAAMANSRSIGRKSPCLPTADCSRPSAGPLASAASRCPIACTSWSTGPP